MTARFREAVLEHDRNLMDIEQAVKDGTLKLADITDEQIISGLHKLAKDTRRPSVALGAWKTLAEMRGLIRNSEAAPVSDEALEQALEEAQERRANRGPRSIKEKAPGPVVHVHLGGNNNV